MATSVGNFSELKTAIEDSSTTEIDVTSDITFSSGGAKVNISKASLTINFNGHTITDNNSATFTDTIYVPSTTNTLMVTVKNAVWSGRNYYGVVGVYNGNVNTTVRLENIRYTGPQFMYNKNGITQILDCTIVLSSNGTSTNPQEFCEANRLSILGNVEVTSNSTSEAVIWFTGTGASLTVEENALFNVNASLTYLLYTDVSPVMLFKKNSSTTIFTQKGLFYASGSASHIASTFTLEEGASFVGYKNQSNSTPMFKCQTSFTINKNSTFQLFSEMISSTALMYFGQTATISINSPKSFLLYNRGGDAFSFQTGSTSSPNKINITTEMLRLWNVATSPLSSAGGFSDTPTSEYFKENYESELNFVITASSSKLLDVQSNLVEGDTGYPVSATSMNLISSKVVSMGELALSVDLISDLDNAVAGKTNDGANVKVDYDQTSLTGTAGEDGTFSVPLESPLSVGTNVTISVNKEFLTKAITVESVGSVSVTKVDDLVFNSFNTLPNLSVIYRNNTDFALEVTDTRASGGEWFLYAYILSPLQSGENTLNDVLVFSENKVLTTINETPHLVYIGNWSQTEKTTTITWGELEGFLLNLDITKEYTPGTYSTNLLWQITLEEL